MSLTFMEYILPIFRQFFHLHIQIFVNFFIAVYFYFSLRTYSSFLNRIKQLSHLNGHIAA